MNTTILILIALPEIIKAILELMKLAEKALPDKNTGNIKKEYVLKSMQACVNNDTLWYKFKYLFSNVINTTSLFNFNSSGKDPEKIKL